MGGVGNRLKVFDEAVAANPCEILFNDPCEFDTGISDGVHGTMATSVGM